MHLRRLWALVPLVLACSERGGPRSGDESDGLRLVVAPLAFPDVGYVCYDVAVTGPGGPVIALGDPARRFTDGDTTTICSWQYGNRGGGDISYIAPCDADDGDADAPARADNTVTVWIDGVYADPDADHDPDEDQDVGDWQDPCPTGCSATFACVENQDTEVALSFTLMRDARQGFFDVAVTFEDLFCSAKLDCVDALLHDPATGRRGPAAVLGFACTSGHDGAGDAQPTHLYLDDLRIECATPAKTYTFDPTDGPGQVGGMPDGVFQVAYYRGRESLPDLDKCYWNASIGLDVEVVADPGRLEGDCFLRARGTASSRPFIAGHTPPASTHPVIDWDVRLTDASGALVCAENPLNAPGSGVRTTYTPLTGERFTCGMSCTDQGIDCAGAIACRGDAPTLPGAVTLSQSGAAVTLNVGGVDYGFVIDPTYTLAACCADTCCTTEVPR